jgi:hypothetical protein
LENGSCWKVYGVNLEEVDKNSSLWWRDLNSITRHFRRHSVRRINDYNIPRFMISVASSIKMDILPGSMLLSTTFSLAGSKAGSDESTTNLTIHLFHIPT